MIIIDELTELKKKDKFQPESWDERGLLPSPKKTIKLMNKEVNKFIDLIIENLDIDKEKLTSKIQEYLNDVDLGFEFDTEEHEWVFDEFCEIMEKVGVDINNIEY